jgi:hypothetical protein
MALVGGTVDSHSSPITLANMYTQRRQRRQQEHGDGHGAREVDERQDLALGHALAQAPAM